MAIVVGWVTLDTPDPQRLAPFWEQLLDWERLPDVDLDDQVALVPRAAARDQAGLRGLLLYHSPDPTPGKNRLHLDLMPTPADAGREGQRAEVERALALGATVVDIGQGDVTWTVLADPEGNEFCILQPMDLTPPSDA